MESTISRGSKVRDVIISKGFSLKFVGQKLKKSRGTISLWVRNEELDYKYIKMIGDVIHHDFSLEFPEMKSSKPWLSIDEKDQKIKDLEGQVSFWSKEVYRMKMAYEELTEKYNMQLAQQNGNSLLMAAEPMEGWEKKKGA